VKDLVKLYANAKLVEDFRIDVDDGRSHAICLDLPREDDGTNMGPSALELRDEPCGLLRCNLC
jgi:hypothetical protein